MSLLIKNAMIVNADKMGREKKDILIEKGVISKIASSIKVGDVKVIDAEGKLVMPGFVDLHVHFRDPGYEYKETILTGSMSAAKGGFTTVFCMPNTKPVIDNASIVDFIFKESKKAGLINVMPVGAITRGLQDSDLTDFIELKKAGCLALTDDGTVVANAQIMRLALEYAKMPNLLLMQHCQDIALWHKGVMNEGDVSGRLGLKGDPAVSETVIVARDIELALYTGGRIHFQHMSLKRSVELIRRAKADGIQVTAEACPHHFTLTEEAVRTFDTFAKVNPSLRTQEDVDAVKQGLKDGTLDCIATDHAPHSYEEKEREFDRAPFGMIGLETAAGLVVTELVNQKVLNWSQMVDRMSAAPVRIMGMKNKGEITEGFDADIVILDSEKEWEVTKADIVSKSKNTPFIGRKLKGRVIITICNGKVVFEDK